MLGLIPCYRLLIPEPLWVAIDDEIPFVKAGPFRKVAIPRHFSKVVRAEDSTGQLDGILVPIFFGLAQPLLPDVELLEIGGEIVELDLLDRQDIEVELLKPCPQIS